MSTTGWTCELNTPEKVGCDTSGGRKKKWGLPPVLRPSEKSADNPGLAAVTDCWSRHAARMPTVRTATATARFILGLRILLEGGRRRNYARRLSRAGGARTVAMKT